MPRHTSIVGFFIPAFCKPRSLPTPAPAIRRHAADNESAQASPLSSPRLLKVIHRLASPSHFETIRDCIGGHYARVRALPALSGDAALGDSDGSLISPGHTRPTERQGNEWARPCFPTLPHVMTMLVSATTPHLARMLHHGAPGPLLIGTCRLRLPSRLRHRPGRAEVPWQM